MKIAIVYFSKQGTTETVARSVGKGVVDGGAQLRIMSCLEPDMDYLEQADAIIFGCPTYMGSAPAEFKKFMDNTSMAWSRGAWNNKIAAAFSNSAALSGDKLGTLSQISLFAFQHGMIWVGLDIMAGKTTEDSANVQLNRLGGWIGLMTQVTKNVEQSSIDSDLRTAYYFGKRIAEQTKRFLKE